MVRRPAERRRVARNIVLCIALTYPAFKADCERELRRKNLRKSRPLTLSRIYERGKEDQLDGIPHPQIRRSDDEFRQQLHDWKMQDVYAQQEEDARLNAEWEAEQEAYYARLEAEQMEFQELEYLEYLHNLEMEERYSA